MGGWPTSLKRKRRRGPLRSPLLKLRLSARLGAQSWAGLVLTASLWGVPGFALAADARRPTPEQRALSYLSREVPRWRAKNKCYSCHNNGDAARALYTALRRSQAVPATTLADTTAWLNRPDRWDANGRDQEFSDRQLARIQFASALAAAVAAGHLKERRALRQAARQVAKQQRRDGSWPIDTAGAVGSPVTYGACLATYLARRVLAQADRTLYDRQLARADRWFRQVQVRTVLDAAAVLLGLGKSTDAGAARQRQRCLAVIRRGQSRDGGWGPYVQSPSEAFDTAVVLLALSRQAQQRRLQPMMRRGRAYLVAIQQPDGSWPETTRPAGSISYAHQISTTAWAVLALLECTAR